MWSGCFEGAAMGYGPGVVGVPALHHVDVVKANL